MTIEDILPWVAYLLIISAIGGPVLYRIIRNISTIRRRKATPGPLLGVVYPEIKKTKDKK